MEVDRGTPGVFAERCSRFGSFCGGALMVFRVTRCLASSGATLLVAKVLLRVEGQCSKPLQCSDVSGFFQNVCGQSSLAVEHASFTDSERNNFAGPCQPLGRSQSLFLGDELQD